MLTLVQPMLTRPFCEAYQVGLSYYHLSKTYKLSVLAADGLLGTVSTGTYAHARDRRAVNGEERADDGNSADDAQQPHE